jgi:hypothetical protein
MIGQGTTVTWDLVASVIQARALDQLESWTVGKGAKLLDAQGVEQVAEAVQYLRDKVNGDVLVIAWNGSQRKASAYTWTVAGNRPVAGAPSGQSDNAVIPYLERLFEAKLENERLKWERDNAPESDGIGRLADVLQQLAPAVISKLTGQPVHGKAPPRGTALVNGVPTDNGEPETAGGMAPDEIEAMLAEVVTFAKGNPEQARQYLSALQSLNHGTGDTNAD